MDAGPDDLSPLPWPLFTIDFEASSLLKGSFPIEVGVCRWQTADDAIEGWSTLIKPSAEWNTTGSWSNVSEEVHRVPREAVSRGVTPTATIEMLGSVDIYRNQRTKAAMVTTAR